MNSLCWDTCSEQVSITLHTSAGEQTHVQTKDTEGGPARFLAPLIQKILKDASLKIHDLDRIGLTVGPGSLTGIRQGISLARGLTLMHPLPTYGISLFELWEREFSSQKDPLILPVDTFGAFLAVQVYEKSKGFLEIPLLIPKNSFPDWLQQKTRDGKHILILPKKDINKSAQLENINQLDIFYFEKICSFLLSSHLRNHSFEGRQKAPLTPVYLHPPVPTHQREHQDS
jgi:tRNA threonylcarbamoyl adenosine modification protein YeaZ